MNKIKLNNFYEKSDKQPLILGLGFFDCVHLGHKKLLEKVVERAKATNSQSAVLTFSTNPEVGSHTLTQVYTFSERTLCMQNLGIKNIVFAEFSETFKNMSGEQFLNTLLENFEVKEVVAGSDFTYGKGAECGIIELTETLRKRNIEVSVVDFLTFNGKKLSTSLIRELIEKGDIECANNLLSEPYFFLSTIRTQNQRGKTFGIPTANMNLIPNRTLLPQGVYATTIEIDNKSLKCVTNVGIKPTFDDNEFAIESHILDFDSDIYGKNAKLVFWKKLRDIIKFDSTEQLKSQIEKDIQSRLSLF